MYRELFADFEEVEFLAPEVRAGFEHRAPSELMDFWEEVPTGFFSSGYMRVIDPVELYKELPEIFAEKGYIPIFASAFGAVICYDGHGTYLAMNFPKLLVSEVGVRLEGLLRNMQSGFFQREMFHPEGYSELVKRFRRPELDECFPSIEEARSPVRLLEYLEGFGDRELLKD